MANQEGTYAVVPFPEVCDKGFRDWVDLVVAYEAYYADNLLKCFV